MKTQQTILTLVIVNLVLCIVCIAHTLRPKQEEEYTTTPSTAPPSSKLPQIIGGSIIGFVVLCMIGFGVAMKYGKQKQHM